MKYKTLKLNGTQESFTEKFDFCIYDCYLSSFDLQPGKLLITFIRYWNNDHSEFEEYSTIIDEDAKRVKLMGQRKRRLPKEVCQSLNRRFSNTWNVKFI